MDCEAEKNGAPGQRGWTWDRVGGRGRRVGYAADGCSSCWGRCSCCMLDMLLMPVLPAGVGAGAASDAGL